MVSSEKSYLEVRLRHPEKIKRQEIIKIKQKPNWIRV
mgnify:CR=1